MGLADEQHGDRPGSGGRNDVDGPHYFGSRSDGPNHKRGADALPYSTLGNVGQADRKTWKVGGFIPQIQSDNLSAAAKVLTPVKTNIIAVKQKKKNGDSSHVMQFFDDEAQARQSARNSSYMLDEAYATGVAVLSKYVEQRDRLKGHKGLFFFSFHLLLFQQG